MPKTVSKVQMGDSDQDS